MLPVGRAGADVAGLSGSVHSHHCSAPFGNAFAIRRDIPNEPVIEITARQQGFWNVWIMHGQDKLLRTGGDIAEIESWINVLAIATIFDGNFLIRLECRGSQIDSACNSRRNQQGCEQRQHFIHSRSLMNPLWSRGLSPVFVPPRNFSGANPRDYKCKPQLKY